MDVYTGLEFPLRDTDDTETPPGEELPLEGAEVLRELDLELEAEWDGELVAEKLGRRL